MQGNRGTQGHRGLHAGESGLIGRPGRPDGHQMHCDWAMRKGRAGERQGNRVNQGRSRLRAETRPGGKSDGVNTLVAARYQHRQPMSPEAFCDPIAAVSVDQAVRSQAGEATSASLISGVSDSAAVPREYIPNLCPDSATL